MSKTYNFVSKAGPHLASHRMRCEIPALLIEEREKTSIANVTSSGDPLYDYNVFNKHFKPEEMIREANLCKSLESTVVFDICDNHFGLAAGPVYAEMCKIADYVTCNTEAMKTVILRKTGREATVVSDPITFPRYEVNRFEGGVPRILWFGNGSTIKSIVEIAPKLFFPVTIVSNVDQQEVGNMHFVPWFQGLVENMIERFDVVALPTQSYTYFQQAKSPNRAVDSLHAGKFVITDNPKIYGELADYIFIGDLRDGIQWFVNNPVEAYHKVKDGQKYVVSKYNHEEIYKQWKTVLC